MADGVRETGTRAKSAPPAPPQAGTGLAPVALLTMMVILWGTAFRATEIGAAHTTEDMFSALRAVPAAVALVLGGFVLRSRVPARPLWGWIALTGLLMVALNLLGLAVATVRAGPGTAAVLINTAPFFVLLLGRLFLGERISPAGVAGLVIGFSGVVLMVSSQLGTGGSTFDLAFGMGLGLTAGLGWAVGTLILKWLSERDANLDVVTVTAGQYIVGGIVLAALALALSGTASTDWTSGELWASVAWVAIGSSALAAIFFLAALRRIPATKATAWQFLAPVVAVVVEAVLGNLPGVAAVVGMGLAIVGVAIVSIAPAREARIE